MTSRMLVCNSQKIKFDVKVGHTDKPFTDHCFKGPWSHTHDEKALISL